jgi:hypothetical protein
MDTNPSNKRVSEALIHGHKLYPLLVTRRQPRPPPYPLDEPPCPNPTRQHDRRLNPACSSALPT